MGRKSKWIEVESNAESAVDVARRALQVRLATVWEWLPSAADQTIPGDDPIRVHQLRVSTRRAMSVLEIFAEMLPPKKRSWFRRRLKHVRKAAGDARDLDVLADRLQKIAEADDSPACRALIERVQSARKAAQQPIVAIYEKLMNRNFPKRVKRLVKKTRWRDPRTDAPRFSVFARRGIAPVASTFFNAASADFGNIEALHQFRIIGKQLRYSIEVFAAAFGSSFRDEVYPVIEQLQAMLGEINDHATGRDRYLTWLDETQEESQRLVLGKLIAEETMCLEESVRRFRQWWTPDRAAHLKARFDELLNPADLRCA